MLFGTIGLLSYFLEMMPSWCSGLLFSTRQDREYMHDAACIRDRSCAEASEKHDLHHGSFAWDAATIAAVIGAKLIVDETTIITSARWRLGEHGK